MKIRKIYRHQFLELETILLMIKLQGGKKQGTITSIGLKNIKNKIIKLEREI